ncbi:RNA polymerase factor sigma-54 [Flavobacteriales bacterium]|jgi:RNA polymerase sigma-54 factor|nr:RNA polymerase factor sigma-54 [Flavobacteriales bacterium]
MQELKQNLKLKAQLSPRQIQLLNLLQTPIVLIDKKIEEELEENPALEEELDNEENYEQRALYKDKEPHNDYLKNISSENNTTIYTFLKDQILGLNITESQKEVIEFTIDSIDEDGLIKRNIQAIKDDFFIINERKVREDEIVSAIKIIKSLEPTGIGSKSVKESLIVQIKKGDAKNKNLIIEIIENNFDELKKNNFEKIKKENKISDETLKLVYDEIEKLRPYPSSGFSKNNTETNFVIPDFFVYEKNGDLVVTVNNNYRKKLGVNSFYKNLYNETKDQETKKFLKQKIEKAQWFKEAIKQREITLLGVMKNIAKIQEKYFVSGDEKKLKPMKLADIAGLINVDISTVSRVTNSKYVETTFGVFLLKELFSEAFTKESGEKISTKEIKITLEEIINSEDKTNPYIDELLCELLEKNGYSIARRTVSKYRESLSIPTARLRKKIL